MGRMSAFLLTSMLLLSACGKSSDESSGRPFEDGIAVAPVETSTSIATPAVTPLEATPGFELVIQFVGSVLAQHNALREAVGDPRVLAACMLENGYRLNGLPFPAAAVTTSSITPIEQRLSPMLTYLTEMCSGVPTASWTK
ncbi:MAG: hypothetical protein EBT80_09500 [Chitinophagales bacterium]|nr:hypothetical protein [Chitinophagales bacterium]